MHEHEMREKWRTTRKHWCPKSVCILLFPECMQAAMLDSLMNQMHQKRMVNQLLQAGLGAPEACNQWQRGGIVVFGEPWAPPGANPRLASIPAGQGQGSFLSWALRVAAWGVQI